MDNLNLRIKSLNLKDIVLIELGGISLGIMLAKLAKSLTEIGFHWYLLAYMLFAIRPLGKLLMSRDNEDNKEKEE